MVVDFELSDEQAMLRDASRDLLTDHDPIRALRTAEGAGGEAVGVVDPRLWRLGCELGWTGLAVPEAHGGTGQGLAELVLVAEELGRAGAPGPFVPTAIVALAVARDAPVELAAQVLPALADGSAAATWAVAEPGRPWNLDGIRATARREGPGFVLDGVKTAVQDAAHARWLLVTALLDDTPTSFLVDRETAGVTLRRQQVLDLTRTFYEVALDEVAVAGEQVLAGGPGAVQRLLDDAAVLTAADALGVMERLLALTVAHVGTRVQFGRPIGSFQAVKQKCATMAVHVHGTRAATHYAAMAADAGAPDAPLAACAAAAYASAVAGEVAGEALQLHGGIGFTWEHELHLHLRRVTVDAALHGDAAVHREHLCGLHEVGADAG